MSVFHVTSVYISQRCAEYIVSVVLMRGSLRKTDRQKPFNFLNIRDLKSYYELFFFGQHHNTILFYLH